MLQQHPARLSILLLLAAALCCGSARRVPAGAPTQIDALPFVIEAPGHYRLVRDLEGPAGAVGIRVMASDVWIELAGHRLIGTAGSLAGIAGAEGIERVRVLSGTVANFGRDGVDLAGCSGASLEGVRAMNNGGHGIAVGADALLADCDARFNHGGRGIVAGDGATLRGCRADRNEYGGVYVGAGAYLDDCGADENVYGCGIRAGAEAVLRACVAEGNEEGGLRAGPRAVLRGCTARGNLDAGIEIGPGGMSVDCISAETRDGPGFVLGAGGGAHRCRAERNVGIGFRVAQRCRVSGSAAVGNELHGISAAGGCRLSGNVCRASRAGDGLRVAGDAGVLEGNDCSGNAGADLRVVGRGNRVFGNRARRDAFLVAPENEVGPGVSLTELEQFPFANVLE